MSVLVERIQRFWGFDRRTPMLRQIASSAARWVRVPYKRW